MFTERVKQVLLQAFGSIELVDLFIQELEAGDGGVWGTITGTLSNQTDLQTALNLKAPLASPTFTGNVNITLGMAGALRVFGGEDYSVIQMTNDTVGNEVTDGLLMEYDGGGTLNITNQEVEGTIALNTTDGALTVDGLNSAIVLDADSVRIARTATPASAGAAGITGTIAWDADYLYVCVADSTWKRVAIATWP